MAKETRNIFDKIKTLLFWKDTRVTDGERYTKVRKFDFSSYFPVSSYIKPQPLPTESTYNIRNFGAVPNDKSVDNAPFISKAICEAERHNKAC